MKKMIAMGVLIFSGCSYSAPIKTCSTPVAFEPVTMTLMCIRAFSDETNENKEVYCLQHSNPPKWCFSYLGLDVYNEIKSEE